MTHYKQERMMWGVNDLASKLADMFQDASDALEYGGSEYMQGKATAYDIAASLVEQTQDRTWHPVSEPPTDGSPEYAFARCDAGEWFAWTDSWKYGMLNAPDCWAHTRDVVLLPPEG